MHARCFWHIGVRFYLRSSDSLYLYRVMRHRVVIICLLSLLVAGRAGAVPYTYIYNENCARAYNYFLALRLAEGRQAITLERKNNPQNLMAVYLADYEDCILLLVNCNIEDYTQRAGKMSERIDELAKGDPSSPWYRFCYAGMYLHRAIINIRFGEQYKAAYNFRKSFALLKENQKMFPSFEYNNVISGLQEAVVGSLPGSYKWLASVFGMKGSVKNGTEKLGAFVNGHTSADPLYTETVLYYLYARFYLLAEQEQVWKLLNTAKFGTKNNLLNTFVKANIALDYRHSDEALELLRAASKEEGFQAYPIFQYQTGMALLTRCDTSCTYYFDRFLHENKSDIFIKDAWQRKAFVWYVAGNKEKAEYCRRQVTREGTARLDADKQAARFASAGVWPNRGLLQARLLIEGGYSENALAILRGINKSELPNQADKAEYNFRMGRVYEEMAKKPGNGSNYKLALAQYREAMTEGKDRHEQFAARAALHMGKIYELLEMDKEAIGMYNECLNMPDHDFQNSIDQQAKSGINRIEWKSQPKAE